MPFTIGNEFINSTEPSIPRFQGSEEVAKKLLGEINTHLTGKTGTLEFKKRGDSLTLTRTTFWNWLWSSSRNQEAASKYITSLLETAYPAVSNNKTSTTCDNLKKSFIPAGNTIGCLGLKKRLETLAIILQLPSPTEGKLPEKSVFILSSPTIDPTSAFLKTCGIKRLNILGKGGFGTAYTVDCNGNTKDFVYKKEAQPVLLRGKSLNPQVNCKFWRQGDIAAARLKDIRNMAQPQFFILLVKKSPNAPQDTEYHYVPADKVKEFGVDLMKQSPNAQVYLHSQIMTRASGEGLEKLIDNKKINTDPTQSDFKNIVHGLYSFVASTNPRNFVHRDIKPQNLIYNKKTGNLTVIDTGLGEHLARRGKIGRPKGASNPKTSFRAAGSVPYLSPRTFSDKKGYGSEVDCHSVAMTLLELIDIKDFRKYYTLEQNKQLSFFGNDPTTYLQKYLNYIGSNSSTAKVLNKNPELKNLINLLFLSSAGGAAGEAAFKQLATNPYLNSIPK
ncbi:MAG: hypothetical protein A3F67_08870 [Verrucomicrobia bacterium RIFCSPHIGHO2_12_FULL_41_10]|nr:MAG: hypothetical protein A3F67_08870 [Verrucomicrobia bacterium RIFCSPHIGHO2_12_FULL_41_10]HLB33829.1 hypothetical protein [Chthoniobacterales bacterium]